MSQYKIGDFVRITRNDEQVRVGWIEKVTAEYVTLRLWGEYQKYRTYNFNTPNKGTGVKEIIPAPVEFYSVD